MKQTIVVTGAAGYVGEMVCKELVARDDVERVVGIDKAPQTDFLKQLPKFNYVEYNLADEGWQEQVAVHNPVAVVHTAWQIRTMYGQAEEQWRWNITGSDNVFKFATATPSVKKLIHFSTAASYSARVDNRLDYFFTENDELREDDYAYANEKKVAEEHLEKILKETAEAGKSIPQVFVVRPAAITGPRGRYLRVRFGLQSALQGNLEKNLLNRVITSLTAVMPVTKKWVRQFIHEDDVVDIVQSFLFDSYSQQYMVFNMVPDSEPVFPKAMGQAVGKKVMMLPVSLVRLAFWFFWHATKGRVSTGPHVWRFYAYPILMSGKKLALVYQCKYSSLDAITYTNGRYEPDLPNSILNSKSETSF